MIGRAVIVVAVGLVLTLGACGDDDDVATTSPTAGPVTDACDRCRRLDVGEDPDVDGMSVGVRQCVDGRCELVVLDRADGSETELDVQIGDTLDVGDGWVVVRLDGDGLTIRPG